MHCSNAKTLGLHHLQFLDMGSSVIPLDGARIVTHGPDELFIQHNTIPDGETAPVQQSSKRSQSVTLSHLIDLFRPGEPFVKGYPKITFFVDLLEWLSE